MGQGHQRVPCSRRPGTRTAEGAESPPRVSKLLTTDEVAEIIRLSQKLLRNGAGSGKRFRSYVLVQSPYDIDSVTLTPG